SAACEDRVSAGACARSTGARDGSRCRRPARHTGPAHERPTTPRQGPTLPPRPIPPESSEPSWSGPAAFVSRARWHPRRDAARVPLRAVPASNRDRACVPVRNDPWHPPPTLRLAGERHREGEGAADADAGVDGEVAVMHEG